MVTHDGDWCWLLLMATGYGDGDWCCLLLMVTVLVTGAGYC